MNEYELSKIADQLDEDAVDYSDYELSELMPDDADSFKKEYFDYYDDIKLTPKEDW